MDRDYDTPKYGTPGGLPGRGAGDQQPTPRQIRDAKAACCTGLFGGSARIAKTNAWIEAAHAVKQNGPFYCGTCYSDAVIRKCTEKADHFAHKARLSPILDDGETELHLQCKQEICACMHAAFPDGKWAVEREIPADADKNLGRLVPDISGRIGKTPVAIEIQVSTLTLRKIIERTTQYSKRAVYLLWIVPLKAPLGDQPFRPRLYERYLHSLYFGRTYYWTKGAGTSVQPVHFGMASRWIEASTWFEDGEEQSGGGYLKPYKTIKKPLYGAQQDIRSQFKSQPREEFVPENEKKKIPRCLIFRDVLACWWPKAPGT